MKLNRFITKFWQANTCAVLLVFLASGSAALSASRTSKLQWVKVSADQISFILEESGQRFVPWGFNYDHDENGRLIEDYWQSEWAKVQEDFREMKELGANVVRIHLQVGKFMKSPSEPNQTALGKLAQLVNLAEQTQLYLDVTGLGCYHKKDVPQWYDQLSEQKRWNVQAHFWEALAEKCANSPAIFCYDLMNEPVVAGSKRTDWLGPAFAGKHFVQFITIDQGSRERPEIAVQWVKKLTAAIRKHDRRRLITVGLVSWSLQSKGLTSGFVPDKIVQDLDFISVHIYPEQSKLHQAMVTLAGFAVGKPVVIEEIFPLNCSMDELGQFIEDSRKYAAGWIGFYWGKTPQQCRASGEIADALTLGWLEFFQKNSPGK